MRAYCGFPEVIPALFYFVPLTLFNVCQYTDKSILKSQGRTIARHFCRKFVRVLALQVESTTLFLYRVDMDTSY